MFKRGAHEKHVTTSNEIEKLGQLLRPNKEPIVSRKGGPGFSSLVIFNNLSNSNGLEQNRYISIETPEVQYLPGTESATMQIRNLSIIEERETTNVWIEGVSGKVTVEVEQQVIEQLTGS